MFLLRIERFQSSLLRDVKARMDDIDSTLLVYSNDRGASMGGHVRAAAAELKALVEELSRKREQQQLAPARKSSAERKKDAPKKPASASKGSAAPAGASDSAAGDAKQESSRRSSLPTPVLSPRRKERRSSTQKEPRASAASREVDFLTSVFQAPWVSFSPRSVEAYGAAAKQQV